MTFDIGQFISETNNAKTVDDLVLLLEKHFHKLGVQTFLISLLNDHPSFGLPARHGVIRSYPEDWMEHYFRHSYERIDPVRLECFKIGPFSWNALMKEQRFSAIQRRMMDEAAAAGLKHGVAVGICTDKGQYAGVGFASQHNFDITKNKIDLLNLLAVHSTRRFLDLSRRATEATQEDNQVPVLTRHQIEVLKWIAAGKTPQEVADRLMVNKKTVDFHLENVYRKLGVRGRAQAISKALQLGLVNTYPELLSTG